MYSNLLSLAKRQECYRARETQATEKSLNWPNSHFNDISDSKDWNLQDTSSFRENSNGYLTCRVLSVSSIRSVVFFILKLKANLPTQ